MEQSVKEFVELATMANEVDELVVISSLSTTRINYTGGDRLYTNGYMQMSTYIESGETYRGLVINGADYILQYSCNTRKTKLTVANKTMSKEKWALISAVITIFKNDQ